MSVHLAARLAGSAQRDPERPAPELDVVAASTSPRMAWLVPEPAARHAGENLERESAPPANQQV